MIGQASDSSAAPPAFDPHARARIDEVATALLDLVGRLEARLTELEQRQAETDDALQSLGLVQVPRV